MIFRPSLNKVTIQTYSPWTDEFIGEWNLQFDGINNTFNFTYPFAITNVQAINITEVSAIINWSTNFEANSSVNYGTTTSLGTKINATDYILEHNITLLGLTNNTIYYYNVTSCTNTNECTTSGTYNFSTTSSTIYIDITYPTTNINVTKNELFNITLNVTCNTLDCGNIEVYLDPMKIYNFSVASTIYAEEGNDGADDDPSPPNNGPRYTIASEPDTTIPSSTELDTIDGSYATATCGANDVCYQTFYANLTTDMAGTTITKINWTINAGCSEISCQAEELYVYHWNDTSSTWIQCGAVITTSSILLRTCTEESNPEDFINSTDFMHMIIHQDTGNPNSINTDFIKLEVTYTSIPTLTLNNTYPDSPNIDEDILFNITCTDDDIGDTLTGYVQLYNNTVQYGDTQSLTVTNDTETTIHTLLAANTSNTETWTGEYWCSDGTANTTKQNDSVTITISKNGLIPVGTGTPFYTNLTNPINVSLNTGESETVTFWVNATGDADNTYEFFAYANMTSDSTINNITNKFNVTIVSETCTCSGSADCKIDCSNNCIITSPIDIRPYNLLLEGTGAFTIESDIYVRNITGDYNCDLILGTGAIYPSIG